MISPSTLYNKIKDKLASKSPAGPTKVIKAISFSDVKNMNRPAPTWCWNLIMPPIPGEGQIAEEGPKNPLLKTLSKFLSAAPDSRIILCESIDISPIITLGTQDRYYNGRMTAFPSLPSVPPVSAVFYETEDYMTTDYFRKWSYEVYNPDTRVYGMPAKYGKDIEFLALPPTDQTEVSRYMSIILKKAWLKDISKYSYGATTDRVKVHVEFGYLDMEVTVVGGPPSDKKQSMGDLANKLSQWKS